MALSRGITVGVLVASLLGLGACARAGFQPREGDGAGLDAADDVDAALKDLAGDLTADLTADLVPETDSTPCSKKTSDNTALHPGCDPQVSSTGVTAITYDLLIYPSSWAVVAGKRWWRFNAGAAQGKGAFVTGGADVATMFQKYQPDCAVKTPDGITLNPGCDPDVKATGVTAMTTVEDGGVVVTLILSGNKWWTFDAKQSSGNGAFVAGGKNLAAELSQMAPNCTMKSADGTHMNPGCDPDVKATGFSYVTRLVTFQGLVLFGAVKTKFWHILLDSTTRGTLFVDSRQDMAKELRKSAPTDCAIKSPDGSYLNAGCDPDVMTKGLDAMGAVHLAGKDYYLMSLGTRWWLIDHNANKGKGTFVEAGKSLASYLLTY